MLSQRGFAFPFKLQLWSSQAVFLGDRIVLVAGGIKREEIEVELPRPRDRLSDEFERVLLRLRRAMAPYT